MEHGLTFTAAPLRPRTRKARRRGGTPKQPGRPVARQTRQLQGALPEGEARRRAASCGVRRSVGPAYEALVREMKQRYKIAVRRWRSTMVGLAYELTYEDGRIKRLISAPPPRSPVSAAIFLHEVGHHAIGFRRYESRCLEEHYVWQWTFREMHARGIPVTWRVMRHFRRSMYHYVRRANRRGEHVPSELTHFGHWVG